MEFLVAVVTLEVLCVVLLFPMPQAHNLVLQIPAWQSMAYVWPNWCCTGYWLHT
jgi:hypothetical protein